MTSVKTLAVLALIHAGVRTKQELMDKTGNSFASITGVVAATKRLGLVEVSETGLITLTPAGVQEATVDRQPAEKRVNKTTLAKELYKQLSGEGKRRCEIVAEFMTQFGMSKAAASTYLQNAKKALAEAAVVQPAEPVTEAAASE
jgi:hypothetical protein